MDKPVNTTAFVCPARGWWPLGRVWALALVTFRQAMRMRLWLLVLPALVVLVLADVLSPRYDPVFEAIPAAASTTALVLLVLAVVVGIFFATYSLPAELESKVALSVVTKPVNAFEIVAGKTVGMSLVLAAMLALVAAGGYAYILVRAALVQSLAARRLEELRPHVAYPADLNAIEAVAANGPLRTYRYLSPSSGPVVDVDLGADKTLPSDAVWVLGETGMRLAWNMAATPLREWAAAGPVRARFSLTPRKVREKTEGPCQVLVAILQANKVLRLEGPQPKGPVYQDTYDLAESGELEVTFLAPDAPPAKGAINLPPDGDLVLYVLATKPAYMLGAGAGSLRLSGAGGGDFVYKAVPEVRSSEMRRRVMLTGNSDLPRQRATFRFDDVPEGSLDPGDTAVEAGFSLDAWAPATVPATAEITFIRADGRSKSLRFSPESNTSTVLYLDRNFWHGGPLTVQVECLTYDDFLGLLPESVRLRLAGGPYVWHFTKSAARVWLFGTVLAAAGVAASTRISWFVSILLTAVFLLLAAGRDWLMHMGIFLLIVAGVIAVAIFIAIVYFLFLKRGLRWYERLLRAAGLVALWYALNALFAVRFLQLFPLPSITWLLPGEAAAMGQAISAGEMGLALALTVLSASVLVALGAMLFKGREVAS